MAELVNGDVKQVSKDCFSCQIDHVKIKSSFYMRGKDAFKRLTSKGFSHEHSAMKSCVSAPCKIGGCGFYSYLHSSLILLCILQLINSIHCSNQGNEINTHVLRVGEELWKESLPLKSGSRLYRLDGLKSYAWYEVKISYPASIPASFSIQLWKGDPDMRMNLNRKLLNTEKLIFKTESLEVIKNQGGVHILVTVEPEGVVAIPHVEERQFIIFNIVCDELFLGIPHEAWWVGVLVLLCLVVAVIIPSYLPSYLLQKNQTSASFGENFSKDS